MWNWYKERGRRRAEAAEALARSEAEARSVRLQREAEAARLARDRLRAEEGPAGRRPAPTRPTGGTQNSTTASTDSGLTNPASPLYAATLGAPQSGSDHCSSPASSGTGYCGGSGGGDSGGGGGDGGGGGGGGGGGD